MLQGGVQRFHCRPVTNRRLRSSRWEAASFCSLRRQRTTGASWCWESVCYGHSLVRSASRLWTMKVSVPFSVQRKKMTKRSVATVLILYYFHVGICVQVRRCGSLVAGCVMAVAVQWSRCWVGTLRSLHRAGGLASHAPGICTLCPCKPSSFLSTHHWFPSKPGPQMNSLTWRWIRVSMNGKSSS
jgi:hypothetical protein